MRSCRPSWPSRLRIGTLRQSGWNSGRAGCRLDDDDVAVASAPGQDGEGNLLTVGEQLLVYNFDRPEKLLLRLGALVPGQRSQIEPKNLYVLTLAVDKVDRFLEGRAAR